MWITRRSSKAFDAVQTLVRNDKLVAYQDKGNGGLLVTLAEMAFAGHCGIKANIETSGMMHWRLCSMKSLAL